MEIAFVTGEVTPYSRHGSAADVCAALPKALRGLGHRVVAVSPLYADVDPGAHALARRLSPLVVTVDGREISCLLFDGRTTGGVDLLFVSHESLAAPAWRESSPEARARAAKLFGTAAAAAVALREPAIEIAHAHGWFAATALAELARIAPKIARVLSLHEAAAGALDAAEARVLAEGAAAATRVVARSQAEALEVSRGGTARGLAAGMRLTGIVDGIDAARWNPLTDAALPARFDPAGIDGKARCKGTAQLDHGLPVDPDVPLVVALLEPGSQAEATLAEGAKTALRNAMQLLVVGASNGALARLAESHPDRVALSTKADDPTLHRALAGADFALLPALPSREAGLGLAAMRYGALPIARRAGALTDALVDCDAKLETGTGFVLDDGEPETIASGLARAAAAFASGERFASLRRKTMKLDLSWERSARRYEQVYRELGEGAG